MIVLGIDQAMKTSGYCVMDDKQNILAVGTQTNSNLTENREFFLSLLEQYKPDLVLIEEITFQRNVKTFQTLAQVQGIYLEAAYQAGVAIETVYPSSWRSKNRIKASKRVEAKREAKELASELFPDHKFTQDSAEAAMIARSHFVDKIFFG